MKARRDWKDVYATFKEMSEVLSGSIAFAYSPYQTIKEDFQKYSKRVMLTGCEIFDVRNAFETIRNIRHIRNVPICRVPQYRLLINFGDIY